MSQRQFQEIIQKEKTSRSTWTLCFAGGFFTALLIIALAGNSEKSKEVRLGGYYFTNPLLSCDLGDRLMSSRSLRSFRSVVQDYILQEVPKRDIVHISIYYRDLNNGPWFGINEHEDFFPSSLLKLPVLVAVLKKAEKEPMIFEKKVLYSEAVSPADQYFKPAKTLEVGKEYSVLDLLERMIRYSDNRSLFTLSKIVDSSEVKKIYNDFGVVLPESSSSSSSDFMDVKSYASFFRVLFNASYLTRDFSEKALSILSKTDFNGGLVAGVPAGIEVAHKFGENSQEKDGKIVEQLHDCGIIYQPNHPYLLCIMTRGNNFSDLLKIIAGVSRVVYNQSNK